MKEGTRKKLIITVSVLLGLALVVALAGPAVLDWGKLAAAEKALKTEVYYRRDTRPGGPDNLGTLWGTPEQGKDYQQFNDAIVWYWERLESGQVETWGQTAQQIVSATGEGSAIQYETEPIELVADYLENETPTDKTVIIAHGFNVDPRDLGGWIKVYYDMGYNILAPSARAHWQSGGDYISFGYYERYDYTAEGGWIDQVIRRNGAGCEIILHGTSMGAGTMMLVSGEELPENVAALTADCGYASMQDVVDQAVEHIDVLLKESGGSLAYETKIGPFPYTAQFDKGDVDALLERLEGAFHRDLHLPGTPEKAFSNIRPLDAVARSQIPILFIHGMADATIPFAATTKQLIEAKGSNPFNREYQVYFSEGAGHGASIKVDRAMYSRRIFEFLS